MTALFDDIIFLISTDCFTDELFGEFPPQDVEKAKQAARDTVPEMLRGGDNYFMCADFSPARTRKTQADFFAKLLVQQVSSGIQQKINLFYETLLGITDQYRTAGYAIGSVAAQLYWLDTARLKTRITDELLNLIALVEPLGLERESHGFEWGEIWLNSASKWDQFVMSLMDGVVEVPYLIFKDATRSHSKFDFLCAWKKHLGENRFSLIRQYILTEAHAELDSIDLDAAKEIDRIMSAI